jgi:L-rhamnose mutarotase
MSPDYSIHFFEPMNLLIAHMRYIGPPEDFEKDMAKVGEDETTRKWWKVRRPLGVCPAIQRRSGPVDRCQMLTS